MYSMLSVSGQTMSRWLRIIATGGLLALAGCANEAVQVQRIAVDEVRDLSGNWNDTDSRLVSNEMVEDMLSRSWLQNHMEEFAQEPTVIVGSISNLSREHINTQTFINDIERELINSGQIAFVANRNERMDIREERLDQDMNASAHSRKAMGQELGADYMLLGSINTLIDAAGKVQVTYYQVDLKLISLTDNRTHWVGQKKIKKLITGDLSRY